jgi:hypothetical protein
MQLNFSKTPVTIGECFLPREEMLNHLTEFETLYSQRPINDNQGGMKAPQAFYAWLVAKKLNPSVIIESGVWFGQGTWIFEKACPDSKIICIEPNQNVIRYRSSRASYTQKDFNTIHWDKEITDPMNALCFFDDHQNALARLPVLKNYGFKFRREQDVEFEGCQGFLDSGWIIFDMGRSELRNLMPYEELTRIINECVAEKYKNNPFGS